MNPVGRENMQRELIDIGISEFIKYQFIYFEMVKAYVR